MNLALKERLVVWLSTFKMNKPLVEGCKIKNIEVCEVHKRENELNILIKDIAKAVISTDSIKMMSQRVYTYMKEHYGECTFGLAVNSIEERKISEFFIYEMGALLDVEDIPYEKLNESKMVKAVLSNKELIDTATGKGDFLINRGVISKAAYFGPLNMGINTIGAFTFQLHERSLFTKEEIMICRELAPFLTIALNNSLQNKRLLENNLRFKKLSQLDDLTELNNRRTFYENFDMAYEEAISKGEISFLFLMDLDGFKGINDNFGHLVGDEVLKKLSLMLCKNFDFNYIGRFGGDEFVVGLPCSTREEAEDIAKKVISDVKNMNICIDRDGTPLSISIGGLELRKKRQLREIFNDADENLYKVKGGSGANYLISIIQ